MEYIIPAVTLAVVYALLQFIMSRSRKKTVVYGETLIMKYSIVMPIIGYISISFGILIAVITIFQLVPTTGNEVVPYLTGFFVLMGLFLVLFQNRITVIITDVDISYKGLFTQKKISWSEINRVSFSFFSEFVFASRGKQIKINVMFNGFLGFLEIMKNKLDPSIYNEAIKKYDTAYGKSSQK